VELGDQEFNHYDESNRVFTAAEKERFQKLNHQLGQNAFDMGMLVTFYYSTPNNTMPFIWKDGFKYWDVDGRKGAWFALLPRKF
jgi:hypothetical protein